MGHVYLALTILLTAYGQVIIKQQVSAVETMPSGIDLIPFLTRFILLRPLVLSGFIAAVGAAASWILALSRFELSYAYPFMSLSFVLVTLTSFIMFREEVTAVKIFGLILIVAGVCTIASGSPGQESSEVSASTHI